MKVTPPGSIRSALIAALQAAVSRGDMTIADALDLLLRDQFAAEAAAVTEVLVSEVKQEARAARRRFRPVAWVVRAIACTWSFLMRVFRVDDPPLTDIERLRVAAGALGVRCDAADSDRALAVATLRSIPWAADLVRDDRSDSYLIAAARSAAEAEASYPSVRTDADAAGDPEPAEQRSDARQARDDLLTDTYSAWKRPASSAAVSPAGEALAEFLADDTQEDK